MTDFGAEYAAVAERARTSFLGALRDAAAEQPRVLRGALAQNARTSFGEAHGFSAIGGEAQFRDAVPIRGYGELAPWLSRVVAGERGVMTEADPVVFLTSSGTTGAAKTLPLTRPYFEQVFLPFFFAALGNTLRYCPASVATPEATLNLKWDPLRPKSVAAHGALKIGASQLDFARHLGQELAAEPGTRASSALIPADIEDELDRVYYRLRVAAEHDVRAVIGINPAMIMATAQLLERWWDRLLGELREGTVLGRRCREPAPERAALLDRLARYHGRLVPSLLWPHVELVFLWTGGAAQLYVDQVRRLWGGHAQVLPAPLAASEAPVAVAIDRHPTAGVLFAPGVYYELVDADRQMSPGARVLGLGEVRPGQELHVIVTHVGGFVRYALGDVVRVVDLVQGIPRVEYACRDRWLEVGAVSLRESHVVDAVARGLRAVGLPSRGAVARAASGPAPRLEVAVEVAPAIPSAGEEAALARAIDEALSSTRAAYSRCRSEATVACPAVRYLAPSTIDADWQARVAAGVRPQQVKDRIFVSDADWAALVGSSSAREGGGAR